jgi:hypothetical protein
MTSYPVKITWGDMREMGVDEVLIYCRHHRCSHYTEANADCWADEVRLSDIEPKFTCTKRGQCGVHHATISATGDGVMEKQRKRIKRDVIRRSAAPRAIKALLLRRRHKSVADYRQWKVNLVEATIAVADKLFIRVPCPLCGDIGIYIFDGFKLPDDLRQHLTRRLPDHFRRVKKNILDL